MVNTEIRLIIFFAGEDGEALYNQQKQDWELTAAQIMISLEGVVAQSCPTLATPWTVAYQASPSMGFSRQEYWSGLPFLLRKAMVFSVVTYGCEICTIKKAGCQRGE